jgi:hypothetical protein
MVSMTPAGGRNSPDYGWLNSRIRKIALVTAIPHRRAGFAKGSPGCCSLESQLY